MGHFGTPGDVYAVPLPGGRFGALVVLGEDEDERTVDLVALDSLGDAPASLEGLRDAPVLTLTHRYYDGAPFAVRVGEVSRLPRGLVPLGHLGAVRTPLPEAPPAVPWKGVPTTLAREDRFRRDAAYREEVAGWATPGAVYTFPLEGFGRYGVARLVQILARVEEDRFAFRRVVVGLRLHPAAPPTLEEVRAALQTMGPARARWVEVVSDEAAPADYDYVGHLEPTPEELAVLTRDVPGSWRGLESTLRYYVRDALTRP